MSIALTRRRFILGTAGLATLPAAGLARASQPKPADVLVIGAGLSGLAAALTLEAAGATVTVLESQRRVGGKMLSFDSVPGRPEVGGQSIGPGYGRVLAAARRYGVQLEDALPSMRRHGKIELVLRGRVINPEDWPASQDNPFPGSARDQMPWQYAARLLNANNPLDPGDVWYAPEMARHDVSMHEFLRGLGASEASIALAYGTNVSYGTSAHDVSALQLMFIDAWGGVQRRIQPTAVYRAPAGNQRIPETMADALEREVHLGQRVVGIDSSGDGVTVDCLDGSRYSARAAICALPFSVVRELKFDPVLSGVQGEAIRTLPHQHVTQIALTAKRPFWKEDGLSPNMWCEGLLSRTFAHRDERDEVVSILVSAYGNKASALDRLGRDAAMARVIDEFERARPASTGLLEGVAWHSWGLDPDSAGDWAVFAPGTVTRFLPAMFAPHRHVHFCGEQTAVANRGMEGAMESGERAAIEVLAYL